MFRDSRSGRIAIVAHCILNQSSRVLGLAKRSSIITEILDFFESNDIGIIQMPCPELTYAGIHRRGQTKEQYDTPMFRQHCRTIAEEIVNQIQEFSRCRIKTEMIIGFDGSPSCGVSETSNVNSRQNFSNHKNEKGTGILIEELCSILEERDISVPFIGIRHETLDERLAEMEKLLQG